MIISLQLSNFQSHRESALKFSPGVNVIIGSSDSGKSAILRALLWLVTNRPSGESFRSTWADEMKVGGSTEVELVVDKVKVLRRKGNGNDYVLNKAGNCMAFSAVGTAVPVEVSKLLNLSDVNIQKQLDAPFLLSETAGEVARQLNSIANLEVIDRATVNIAREVREHVAAERTCDAELMRIKTEMIPFDGLEEQERELVKIQTLHDAMTKRQRYLVELSDLLREIRVAQAKLDEQGDVDGMVKLLGECSDLHDALAAKRKRQHDVDELRREIREQRRNIDNMAPMVEAQQELDRAKSDREKLVVIKGNRKRLLFLATETGLAEETIQYALGDEKKAIAEKARIMPKTCPVCGK